MSAILCEGIDEDMAMLKIFKRYFKLKGEMKEIEEQIKTLGFRSVEECIVLTVLVENNAPITRATIHDKSQIANGTINSVLANLSGNRLVKQEVDKTDTTHNTLKRQIYTPTQAGIDLIEKLKQQLQ